MNRTLILLAAVVFAAGCDTSATDERREVNPSGYGIMAPDDAISSGSQQVATSDDAATAESDAQPADTGADSAESAASETIQKPAGVGATGKGNYRPGPVTTPVATYFQARERLVFDVAVPHAMNLYQATNGELPKSHEEFMENIIRANNIQLPELPEGHKYIYDPEKKQLMVEQPAN